MLLLLAVSLMAPKLLPAAAQQAGQLALGAMLLSVTMVELLQAAGGQMLMQSKCKRPARVRRAPAKRQLSIRQHR